jgi:hypothetical protein
MLQRPLDYVRSIHSYVYVRQLNFGFILLKTKTLEERPPDYFMITPEEEENVISDERLVAARNDRGRYPEFYYKMPPNFFESYDLTRMKITSKSMLLYWLKYFSSR